MATLTVRARALLVSEHGRRLVKFATVSVISTVITQGLLAIFYDAISLGSAMVCNVIATGIATIPAYWLNRTWTWGKRGRSHPWKEVAPFWIIAFVGMVLSTIAVGIAAHNADAVSHAHVVRRIFVQCANFVTYGAIWIGRYFIFNRFLFGAATQKTPIEAEAPDGVRVPGEVEAIVVEEHRAHDDAAARTL